VQFRGGGGGKNEAARVNATTASTEPGWNFSVSKSIAPANNRASASTGVMSLN